MITYRYTKAGAVRFAAQMQAETGVPYEVTEDAAHGRWIVHRSGQFRHRYHSHGRFGSHPAARKHRRA